MKFNTKAFALTCGIVWGFSMMFMTVWVVAFGHMSNGFLDAFTQFYYGYSISYVGSVVGLIWGFFDGLVGGFIFAWLYNCLSEKF